MANDCKIISKLKARDEQAFKEIYYKYYKLVFYQAYEILNNKEDAEDVMQNTFIKFMKNVESIDDDSSLKQLLSKIAKNEAIDLYRRKANKPLINDDYSLDNIKEEDNQDYNTILTLNNLLEPLESKVSILKIVYDYSFSEIAKDLNLSIGVIQSTYYKAISKLKTYYKENI